MPPTSACKVALVPGGDRVVVVERLLLADAVGVLSAYGNNHYRFVHGNDVVHDV